MMLSQRAADSDKIRWMIQRQMQKHDKESPNPSFPALEGRTMSILTQSIFVSHPPSKEENYSPNPEGYGFWIEDTVPFSLQINETNAFAVHSKPQM